MRSWIASVLLVGLAVLPSSVRAQYPPAQYYNPAAMRGYPTPYYYQPAPPPAWGYYPQQPMPAPYPAYPAPAMQMSTDPMRNYGAATVYSIGAQKSAPATTLNVVPPSGMSGPTYMPSATLPAPKNLPPISLPAPPREVVQTQISEPKLTLPSTSKSADPEPNLTLPSASKSTDPEPKEALSTSLPAIEKTPATKTLDLLNVPPLPSSSTPKPNEETKSPTTTKTPPPTTARTPLPTTSAAVREPETGYVTMNSPLADHTSCCNKSHRLVIFGDYLYWNVHGVDIPFAQAFDGILPGLSVPRGPVAVVSPRYNSGVRVGGGMTFHDGNAGLFGTFTYFQTTSTAATSAPDPFVLHNFLAFPGTINSAADSLTASAAYRIRLVMADVDYKCALVNNEHFYLNWLAGVRYAKVDQNLTSTFQITGSSTVNSDINFDGVGPRVGLDGQYHICGGFFGYAQGIFDVLFGQYRANYEQRNVFTGLVGQTSITTNRVVPILELEVGGGWQSAQGGFRISGGYYVGSWFNTLTMTSLASGIIGTDFTTNGNNFRDNTTFDGFVLRCEFRY